MYISETMTDELTLTLAFTGRVDNAAIGTFTSALEAAPDTQAEHIILNFSAVDYLNSAALRAIAQLYKVLKKQGKQLTLSDPSENVRDVLEISGLIGVFHIAFSEAGR